MLIGGWFLALTTFTLLFASLGRVDGLRASSLPFKFGSKQCTVETSALSELPLAIHRYNVHGNVKAVSSIPYRNVKLSVASTTAQPDVPVSKFPPVPTQKECLAFVIPALGTQVNRQANI